MMYQEVTFDIKNYRWQKIQYSFNILNDWLFRQKSASNFCSDETDNSNGSAWLCLTLTGLAGFLSTFKNCVIFAIEAWDGNRTTEQRSR